MDKVVYEAKVWRWNPSKEDYEIGWIELPTDDRETAIDMFRKNFKSKKFCPQVDLYESFEDNTSKLAMHCFTETGSEYTEEV